MQTLDIECPSCSEMLELDAGFAGGVCRCSNCGTLMTVPSDAGKAESLTRPTSSTRVGAGGLDSMGIPDPGPRRSSRDSKSSRGKKGKAGKGKRLSTTIEAGEYRTASGKVIRLDEPTRVPMAESKKKQIRMATTAVFFAVVAAVVAVAVVAIVMITGGGSGPGGSGGDVTYDPAANPYTLTYANVMGLPVAGKTVVVVEASEYSEPWSSVVGDVVAAGLSQKSKGGEVTLVGAGGKPVLFAGGAPRKLPIDADEVRGWFAKLPTSGEADIGAAISNALEWKPDTLVVVVGYADSADIESWNALVAGNEGLQVHAVHIGNSSPELQGWMSERDGEAVVLSIDQIEYLKEAAAEEPTEEE